MSERPYLSVSQIEMLSRCGLQWYFRYGLGIKSPPGVAAIIGKGTHKAVELDLLAKKDTGELLSEEQVKATAADATLDAWERAGEVVVHNGDPDQGGAIDQAVALASLHHKTLAPKIEPEAVEEAFQIDLPELTHDLVGVIDVRTPSHIRDTKTKSRAPAYDAARRSTQLAAYGLAWPDRAVALDFLVKTQNPYVLTVEATIGLAERVMVLERVERAAMAIKSGVFQPANPGDWCCSKKWCGYWNRCQFGGRQQVSVGLIDPSRLRARVIPHPHAEAHEDADATP